MQVQLVRNGAGIPGASVCAQAAHLVRGTVGRFGVVAMAVVAALGTSAGAAAAATVGDEVPSLLGDWQGSDGSAGTAMLHVVAPTAPASDILATGAIEATSGAVVLKIDFVLLEDEPGAFLVPGTRPRIDTEGAYTASRLPSGGLKLVRFVKEDRDNDVATYAEEVIIGPLRHDGTRSLKIDRAAARCWDGSESVPTMCTAPATVQFVLKKSA